MVDLINSLDRWWLLLVWVVSGAFGLFLLLIGEHIPIVGRDTTKVNGRDEDCNCGFVFVMFGVYIFVFVLMGFAFSDTSPSRTIAGTLQWWGTVVGILYLVTSIPLMPFVAKYLANKEFGKWLLK
jgi:uncharacterized membrane protein (DUF485 family)